jgi:serine protease Do
MLPSMIALRRNAINRCWRRRLIFDGWLTPLIFLLLTASLLDAAEPARSITVYRLLQESGFPLAPGAESPFRILSPEALIAAERFVAAPVGEKQLLTTYDAIGLPVKYDYFMMLNGKMQRVTLESADAWMNLAVLRVNEPLASHLARSTGASLNVGEPLVAAMRDSEAAQSGRREHQVSATLMKLPGAATAAQSVHDFGGFVGIEGDAPLSPGMPLLNGAGELAAIATGVVSERQSLCIAIDSGAAPAIESLIQQHRPLQYGFLGLEPGSVKDLPGGQSLSGVYVRRVMQHAPATRAGLREENPRTGEVDVIAEVNGEAIDSRDRFLLAIGRLPFESIVKLTIRRGKIGGEMETVPIEIKLAKRFAPPERPFFPALPLPPWRGISVDYFTAIDEYAARARLVDPEGCVAIVAVATDSTAWRAGLRPGQFLTHLGEARIKDETEFIEAARDARGVVKVKTTARSDGIRLEPQIYELAP